MELFTGTRRPYEYKFYLFLFIVEVNVRCTTYPIPKFPNPRRPDTPSP